MLSVARGVVALPVLSAPSSLHFPNGVVEASVVVTNIGGSTITISGLTFTGGPPVFPALGYFVLSQPLTIASCNIGFVMPPGGTCIVKYGYVQIAPGANSEPASLTLGFNGGASFETMLVNLVADPPVADIPALSMNVLMLLIGAISVAAVVLLRRRDA